MHYLNRLIVEAEQCVCHATKVVKAGRDVDVIDEELERLAVVAARLARNATKAREAIGKVAVKQAQRKPIEWESAEDTVRA